MKKLMVIFLLIQGYQLQAIDIHSCRESLEQYGSLKVEEACVETLSATTSGNRVKDILGKKVVATENAIFVTGANGTSIQAGDQAKVRETIAVALSSQTLAGLKENGDIYLYHAALMGNVAPKKILQNRVFFGAVDIAMGGETVAVLNPKEGMIYFLDANQRINPSLEDKEAEIQKTTPFTEESIKSISYNPESRCFELKMGPEAVTVKKPDLCL